MFGNKADVKSEQYNIMLAGGSKEALYFTSYDTTRKYIAIHRSINLYDYFILDSGATGSLIGRKDLFILNTYTAIDSAESNSISSAKLKPIG